MDRPQFVRLHVAGGRAARAKMYALAALIVAVGGALLAVGFFLLLLLAAAGVAIGAGWLLVHRARRLFGGARPTPISTEIAVVRVEPPVRSRPDSDPRPWPGTAPDRLP